MRTATCSSRPTSGSATSSPGIVRGRSGCGAASTGATSSRSTAALRGSPRPRCWAAWVAWGRASRRWRPRASRGAAPRGVCHLPYTLSGWPHGHPAHDPLWAAAEELDAPIAIHTGVDPTARDLHHRFDGLAWPEGVVQGIWYLQLMFAQAVQQAFSTFFLHATFDRFPRLKLVVLESGAGWLAYWLDPMDPLAPRPPRVTLPLRQPPSTYVR